MGDCILRISDILLITALFAISFIPLAFSTQTHTKRAVIHIDNELYKTVDLSVEESFKIKTAKGENTVEVKNNSIAVIKADCKDRLCVKSGAVSKPSEIIACLPHKILIEIEGEDD